MDDTGTSLRKPLQEQRSLLSSAEQRAAAIAILDFVRGKMPTEPGVVAGYVAHAGELDVFPAIEALRERGWEIVLPVCGPDASMEFCPWSPGDVLQPNRYGIGEPESAPVRLESIDVVLVPGVGFDTAGSRIGHGVGFYDRFFARCFAIDHDPLRLAIAHDLQVVDRLPQEPWDVSMHSVITPTKVIDTSPCA